MSDEQFKANPLLKDLSQPYNMETPQFNQA
jgi:hypothetical protein